MSDVSVVLFSGEAMLRRVTGSEVVLVIEDTRILRQLVKAEGGAGQILHIAMLRAPDGPGTVANTAAIRVACVRALQEMLGSLAKISPRHSIQCAMLCRDPAFAWFLQERLSGRRLPLVRVTEAAVVDMVYRVLEISSRAELDDDELLADWRHLIRDANAWAERKEAELEGAALAG